MNLLETYRDPVSFSFTVLSRYIFIIFSGVTPKLDKINKKGKKTQKTKKRPQ